MVLTEQLILMGVIGKPHGIRGAVHVRAYAEDPARLAQLSLQDRAGRRIVVEWISDGIAHVFVHEADGIRRIIDRRDAEGLANTELFIARSALPPAGDEEFYVVDLIGLDAIGADGGAIGVIAAVHDFGAGAVIELDSGSLLPFTRAVVPSIDVENGRAIVVPPVEVEIKP